MRKPDFFILGAPKCGTTALAQWLSSHPDVFMSPIKEPHHFNTDMRHRGIVERADYEALFREAGPNHRAVGEASIWYLMSEAAVENIEAYADRPPRYIVCLRNPVDMAYSLHGQKIYTGTEFVHEFETAWAEADARRAVWETQKSMTDPRTLIYPDACALGRQVARLLARIPRERVLFILQDDLAADGRAEFVRVQRFLDLPVDDSIALPVVNAARRRRSAWLRQVILRLGRVRAALGIKGGFGLLRKIDHLNEVPNTRPPLTPALRDELTLYFQDEVALLEQLLDHDLTAWKSGAQGHEKAS